MDAGRYEPGAAEATAIPRPSGRQTGVASRQASLGNRTETLPERTSARARRPPTVSANLLPRGREGRVARRLGGPRQQALAAQRQGARQVDLVMPDRSLT